MSKYTKLYKAVRDAEAGLIGAKADLVEYQEDKKVSPKEVIEELGRMAKCQDWKDIDVDKIGEILIGNIFSNRDAKIQQDRDLYDRDY